MEDYADAVSFDAINRPLGPDPSIRSCRLSARRNAPVAAIRYSRLHEPDLRRLGSLPGVEIWDKAARIIMEFFQLTPPHHDVANRLIDLFTGIGLPCPNMFCEIPAGGGTASPIYAWFAEGIRSLLPQLEQMGMATGNLMPIDSLELRLRAATVATLSQVEGPTQICAWATH